MIVVMKNEPPGCVERLVKDSEQKGEGRWSGSESERDWESESENEGEDESEGEGENECEGKSESEDENGCNAMG